MADYESVKTSAQQSETAQILLRWALFTCAVSVVPLGVKYGLLHVVRQYQGFAHMINDGSLFLIACAITAEAIGDTVSTTNAHSSILALLVKGCSVLVLVLSASFYGGLAALAQITNAPAGLLPALNLDVAFFTNSSIVLFGIAVIAGTFSKWYTVRAPIV